MCLKIFAITFVILSFVLVVQLLTLFFGLTKKMEPLKASAYVSSVAMMVFIYVINAVLLAIFLPSLQSKLIMLLFAFSPFIIGKISNYPNLKYFNTLQILCVIMGGAYILLI